MGIFKWGAEFNDELEGDGVSAGQKDQRSGSCLSQPKNRRFAGLV